MYQVILRKKAKKELERIDKKNRERIISSLVHLRSTPSLGKKLVGEYEGCYSLRVWPYRVIYQIHKQQQIVFVIRIGHRQEAYK